METAQMSDGLQTGIYQPMSGIMPNDFSEQAIAGNVFDCRPQHFEEVFNLTVSELMEQKKQVFDAMAKQILESLNIYSTHADLVRNAAAQVTVIMNRCIEELVAKFDNSILAFSEVYFPWRADLLNSARATFKIRSRRGDEEASVIGLFAGAVAGAGVAGVGGAFLGAIVGDLAGGLFGEPVDKLRKKTAGTANKKTAQIDSKISEFFKSQIPVIKKTLICRSGYSSSSLTGNHARLGIN